MSNFDRKLAWGRIALLAAGVLLFAVLLYLGPPADGMGDPALLVLGVVLAILGGFMLAITSMQGDPGNLYFGGWEIASMHRRQIRNAMFRSSMLSWICLSAIALGIGAMVLGAYTPHAFDSHLVQWTKHVALSLGCAALVWSFGVPAIISRVQLDRLDEEVEKRKKKKRKKIDRLAKDIEDWKRED